MSTIFLFITALILVGFSFGLRTKPAIWIPAFFASILFGQWIGWVQWSAIVFWPVFAFAVGLAVVPQFRQKILTGRIFKFFQAQLPPLSDTEKAAIDAGDIGWEAELFRGRPNWETLKSLPKTKLSPREKSFLDNQVQTLCSMVDDWEILHERADLPKEAWEYLKSEKFFGMMIPENFGGLGFSELMHSTVITQLATKSQALAITAMVPNSLGPGELLKRYGTEQQKEHYLPRLAQGLDIPCFALTGPEAGSDAGAIPDKGIVCKGEYQGKEVIGLRINFDKRYITLAPVATLIGLAFKVYDPEHLLGNQTDIGISLALIPANHPGIEVGHRHYPLRMGIQNGPIRGKDVFIPLEWIIGGSKNLGQGWKMLFECLSVGRGISLPAISTAGAMISYKTTGAYSAIRKQFNTAIGKFEGVEESLSRIAGFTYMLESIRLFTASSIDQGARPAVATAIAKYHSTELARQLIDDSMDVHAGRAIMMGPYNYIASAYQSMPLGITVEGANILTRCLIIFGQGAIRCHPFLKEELQTLDIVKQDPTKALEEFDGFCTQHISYAVGNFFKTLGYSLTQGRLTALKQDAFLRRPLQKLNWMSAGLAWFADVAMLTLGGQLKRKERLSARLGDVLSHLYMASAVINYYQDSDQSQEHKNHAKWCLEYNLYQAQQAFIELLENFPNKVLAKTAKWIIFPYGQFFSKPSDKLSSELAQAMMDNSRFREKLTHNCYVGDGIEDPIGLMENAFQKFHRVKSSLAKVSSALRNKSITADLSTQAQIQTALAKNILTPEEAKDLHEYEVLRMQAIAVDEFSSDYALGSDICETTTTETLITNEQSIL